jgi:GNAT superfamily N-acetyltransferase
MEIERLDAIQARSAVPLLVDLLHDALDDGACLGFLPPITGDEARSYWQGVVTALQGQSRMLFVAWRDEQIVGTVQLDLALMPNARHRAEVMKLMVHRSARRQGIGRALLAAAEDAALQLGRTLLVLDTRRGDASEHLCRACGYTACGVVPNYTLDSDGSFRDAVFFYRQL